jgi:bifunctional UDP-N-acetylglucosamine pyrophosphorylase/glucosamine-1-phosphate N-acetyltransferase
MPTSQLSLVILAAGKGTRMRSARAKVLHEVFFAPMIHHVLTATLPLQVKRTLMIIGHQAEAVKGALAGQDVEFVVQQEQLGTGHAVLTAETALPEKDGTVMILCGDTPLIRSETLINMVQDHRRQAAVVTLMTTTLADPSNYGRVLCGEDGRVQRIVEQKDATADQLLIREINAGIYCVDKEFLFSALKKVGSNNSQGEVYLTDIIALAVDAGHKVNRYLATSPVEVLGVNSRVELAEAESVLQQRRNRELMLQGVSMQNPETTRIAPDSEIGSDCLLETAVQISGGSRIGSCCRIGQGAILENCRLGSGVQVGPYSYLNGQNLAADTVLPPFSTGG